MSRMPRDPRLDSSLALLADPYRYIGEQCRAFGTDLFEARLLLQPAICMTGPAAAALFYDPQRFVRAGVAPGPLRATLFGNGGVQGLDGADHHHRKALFMALMQPATVAELGQRYQEQLERSAAGWIGQRRVRLYEALHLPLARAVCAWADVPWPEAEEAGRCADLVALFDQAAAPGRGHFFHARAARKRCEAWAGRLVEAVRQGRQPVRAGSALAAVAMHRDAAGQRLPVPVAAVELLNLLRPTVAVSVYVVFVAHALHRHPECALALQQRSNGDYAECFVQEVRRCYPFFPAVVARVREDFEWNGYAFPAGRRVLLDLYGTNLDPRTWHDPLSFQPERFRERTPGRFDFVPQGGGDPHLGHRCPGEAIALELMQRSARFFATRLRYAVPEQDLTLDMTRAPALPRDRMVIAQAMPALP